LQAGETFDRTARRCPWVEGALPEVPVSQIEETRNPMQSLFAALGLVFVAELGDKTQMVALTFGARHKLAPVLVGVALAYMATNLLSVLIGGLLGATLPTRAIGIVGGVLFLGFAWWTLRSGNDEPEAPDPLAGDADAGALPGATATEAAGSAHRSVIVSTGLAMFVAEFGDKTMLATATLAAKDNSVLTWIGATIGIICAGALGAIVGKLFGARLPARALRIGSAAMFFVFGIILIVTSI
jgi:putative Ca2+/H+ antiporter (TMEM165/GDT1 family)